MKVALLIPIFEPNEKVIPYLKTFDKNDFDSFLVVDDGSGENYRDTFKQIAAETVFKVISYPSNQGKGYALKTGIQKLIDDNSDLDFIVTADGDGQHLKKDIMNIKNQLDKHQGELVFGTRDFSKPNVPRNSLLGNQIFHYVFRILTGLDLKDTQTGLRAIPSNLFETALEAKGERYEYEFNFLIDSVREAKLATIDIETVYENNNKGSHYRPYMDTYRIAKNTLFYSLVVFLTFLLDAGLFSALLYGIFGTVTPFNVCLSNVFARIVSDLFIFLMLKCIVFPRKKKIPGEGVKYVLLLLVEMALSTLLTVLMSNVPGPVVVYKMAIDILIGIVAYFFNRLVLFRCNKKRQK